MVARVGGTVTRTYDRAGGVPSARHFLGFADAEGASSEGIMRAGRAMRACLMAACLAQSCALAAAYVSHGARIGLMRTRTGPLMSADSEEEIAALQARISELKRAQEEQAEASEAAAADSESSGDDSGENLAADFEEARIRMAKLEEREFDLKTLSFRRKVNNAQ